MSESLSAAGVAENQGTCSETVHKGLQEEIEEMKGQ